MRVQAGLLRPLRVSVATGWGLHWISGTLFSTPARVRLAITPATGTAWTLSSLLHDVGVSASFRHIESATRVLAAALAGLYAVTMLLRTRTDDLVRPLGLALIALALGGPAAWPWYFTWGLVLLAATASFQRSRTVPIALIVGAFLVKANGILVLPLRSAPYVVAVYLVVAAVGLWYLWNRRGSAPARDLAVASPRSSTLARSSTG